MTRADPVLGCVQSGDNVQTCLETVLAPVGDGARGWVAMAGPLAFGSPPQADRAREAIR
jgi:hypothetical protein